MDKTVYKGKNIRDSIKRDGYINSEKDESTRHYKKGMNRQENIKREELTRPYKK